MSHPSHRAVARRLAAPRTTVSSHALDAPRAAIAWPVAGAVVAASLLFTWAAVRGQSPDASPEVAPLPVRIVEGTCEEPGDRLVELTDAMALEAVPDAGSLVFLSVSSTDEAIDDLVGEERALLVGGTDAESAVVCGGLGALQEAEEVRVALLSDLHGSGHSGVALMRGTDDGTTLEVVVVSPVAPEASPGASPASPDDSPAASPGGGSPGPSASGLSPVRSAEPGTSGAPPFSPLPGGTTAP